MKTSPHSLSSLYQISFMCFCAAFKMNNLNDDFQVLQARGGLEHQAIRLETHEQNQATKNQARPHGSQNLITLDLWKNLKVDHAIWLVSLAIHLLHLNLSGFALNICILLNILSDKICSLSTSSKPYNFLASFPKPFTTYLALTRLNPRSFPHMMSIVEDSTSYYMTFICIYEGHSGPP